MCIHCSYIGYIMKSYAYPKDAIFKKETLISTHIEHRTATRIVLILLQVSVKESGKKYQRGKRVDQNRWHKIPRWHLHITIMILKKEEGRPNVASMEILCCRCERRSIYQKDKHQLCFYFHKITVGWKKNGQDRSMPIGTVLISWSLAVEFWQNPNPWLKPRAAFSAKVVFCFSQCISCCLR